MDAQHTKHVSYKLADHFVWCPNYRKKILVGKLATFVEEALMENSPHKPLEAI